MSRKIAILGTGRVGSALAGLWAAAGHQVLLGSRDATKAQSISSRIAPSVSGMLLADALKASDLVVEALPFPVALQLDPKALDGKVLISASNYHPRWNGPVDLGGVSHTEAVARRLPGTDVVKAFNMHWADTVAVRIVSKRSDNVAMIVAGGGAEAKDITMQLVVDAWFEPVDAGPLPMGAAFQPGEALYADRVTRTPPEAKELLRLWHHANK